MEQSQQSTFTAAEISAKYGVALSTLTRNFRQAQESIEKRHGIRIAKRGRGNNTFYFIENFVHADPARALTLYDSLESNMVPTGLAVGLLDLQFLIFIGIVSSPQRSFRGSYVDLLSYIDIQPSLENIEATKMILYKLATENYIMYMTDPSDAMYFMAAVQRKTETDMQLEIKAILEFKKLVEGTRKSWIPLMKVYFALHLLDQPCTIAKITEITGLTDYKVRDSLAILANKNIILKQTMTIKDPASQTYYCLGTQIDLNAFGIQ